MSASADSIAPPLSQGVGYGITVGVGAAFAVAMIGITALLKRFTGENNGHFETYSTAGRNVGVGLVCVAVISSWGWPTALLSSSVVTYNYGVSGAFWFASGCLVQISFFSLIAIQSKLRAPHAHTSLELVKVRYGTVAHWLYMFLCLVNNLIAIVNMFLGASATIAALTGMNTVASIFLLPVGVVVYTVYGGLRATFITDYLHTVCLLIIVTYLSLKTITNDQVQSPRHLFDLVNEAALTTPVSGNKDGSYFTMSSKSGVLFGLLHTLGNFGLVIMDSSYWQKGFSANQAAAVRGYILGGILYFAMPFVLGTTMGLAAVGLGTNPIWPTYGRALSMTELNDGLPLAYTAYATAGKGGAVAVVLLIFMACTSTCSAQIVAVSSIISSDFYHAYLNPAAKDKAIINVSRLACVLFALVGCAVSAVFWRIGLNLTWTLYFLGIITTPGMVTLPLTILWKKQTKLAAIVSPIVGIIGGLATWISTAYVYGDGQITVTTTGALLPCVWGTVVSSCVPAILTLVITYAKPDEHDWDWSGFNRIKLVHYEDDSSSTLGGEGGEKKKLAPSSPDVVRAVPVEGEDTEASLEQHDGAVTSFSDSEVRQMNRASRVAAGWGIFLFLAVWVVWPFGMWGYVFDWQFFTGWVVVSFIWIFITLLVAVFLPPLEGLPLLVRIVRGLVTGKKGAQAEGGGRRGSGQTQLIGREDSTPSSSSA